MVDEAKLKPCSLFLVHYVPDLERGESMNIGLFLHSPDEKFLGCLFTDDFRRVKRFHPQADLECLRELQLDFEQQIDEHSDDLEGYLGWMNNSFSNLIQLGAPRTCLLRDPQSEIRELFERYVGPRLEGPLVADTRLRIKQRLTTAFVRAGLWERLEKRIPAAPWTQPGDSFTFDYGYRPLEAAGRPNGHIKLIHALSLQRDAELAKVLVYTMDHVRRKEPAELTAVTEGIAASGDQAGEFSQRILEEGKISICPLVQAGDFAQTIRQELRM